MLVTEKKNLWRKERFFMSAYSKTLSRLGMLAILITGLTVMTKPAAAATACQQQCMDTFNACIADCPPRQISCGTFCRTALLRCETACNWSGEKCRNCTTAGIEMICPSIHPKTISCKLVACSWAQRSEKKLEAVTEKRWTMSVYKNALSRLGFFVILIGLVVTMLKPANAATCVQVCNADYLTCLQRSCSPGTLSHSSPCGATCERQFEACLASCPK